MSLPIFYLKKNEARRILSGHPWVYSNEIDSKKTPLKDIKSGEEVFIAAHNSSILGRAYANPHSLIIARIFSKDPEICLDLNFFLTRLQHALALRTRLFKSPYYRLIFSEADYLPGLIIDRYDQDFVVQLNTAGMEQQQTLLARALTQLFPTLSSVLLRNDSSIRKQEGLDTYVRPLLGTPPAIITLEENGIQFQAPLLEGQKTGWFYDHRLNRARLAAYVENRSVLDVFSYLGGFGIEAACFGASHVTCIDASTLACQCIQKNAELNHVSEKTTIINDDAFDALKKLLHQDKKFDVIILDPPAFVKKNKDLKEGLIAYQRLNEFALKLLSNDGILISCSCSMQVSEEEFQRMLNRAAYNTKSQVQILERGHQGPDHPLHIVIPETNYLKAIFLRKV